MQALWDQNAVSTVETNKHVTCCYRSPIGTKCALGHLISDDQFNPDWNQLSIKEWEPSSRPYIQAIVESTGLKYPDDWGFCRDLQRLHDFIMLAMLDNPNHVFRRLLNAQHKEMAKLWGFRLYSFINRAPVEEIPIGC